MIKEIFEKANKIVIKVGTSAISGNANSIETDKVSNITKFSSELIQNGKKIIIVSSGAISAGRSVLSFSGESYDSVEYKQALSSIGQIKLLQAYRESFLPYYIPIGQILLTNDDFENQDRKKNILNTINVLSENNIVPIINENDGVSTEEIAFGDNDMLAVKTAKLINSDLVIMLSNIDGVYKQPPKENDDNQTDIIENISDIALIENKIKIGEKSKAGTGGIKSKLIAGEELIKSDIPMFLFNGRKEFSLSKFEEGKIKGTLFNKQITCYNSHS